MKHLTVNAELKNFVLKNHAEINSYHKSLCEEGFTFLSRKTRFWSRKDGGVSVKLVYGKQSENYSEEQNVLLRLNAEQTTLNISLQRCNGKFVFSYKGTLK
ncbi:hypothetical protein [Bartonella sp. HY761]|uniref:hypothetical protein n=1 Tax=Bartonella sp. HY761 TaxID=2979330 RepID=UPI002202AB15|nr:hypothetical protein [Bartonella sp. HY761]UXN07534.1 hypothetical protein N6A79_05990 [Bartonella sp. HY761]